MGLIGAVIAALGLGVVRGHLGLLANYQPGAVEDERRVARLSGGAVLAFGLLTLGLAWGLWTGRAGDWWWAGWALIALALGGAAAMIASGRL